MHGLMSPFTFSPARNYRSGMRRPFGLRVAWNNVESPPPQIPVPENPTPLPPEMPQPAQPIGEPPPMENPIPMREPPATLPPQS